MEANSWWDPRTRLSTLTFRLNSDAQQQLASIAESFKHFAFIRTLRLDLAFPLTSLTSDVVKNLQDILQTSTFKLARRFFDDVPMQLHFGLQDENEAVTMRRVVEDMGELLADVFVDVLEM